MYFNKFCQQILDPLTGYQIVKSKLKIVHLEGLEPSTNGLRVRCSTN